MDCRLHDFLESEGSAGVEIGLGGKIKIYIFNVEVHQKRCRVPKRPADFEILFQASGLLADFSRLKVIELVLIANGQKNASSAPGRGCSAEEFCDASFDRRV